MAKICPQAESWGISGYEAFKTSYKWIINNFEGFHETEDNNGQIQSQSFGSYKDIETKWFLSVFPFGNTEENEEFVSISLNLDKSDKEKVVSEHRVSIVDTNQRIFRQMEMIYIFDSREAGENEGWPQFISRSDLENPENQLLPNGVLTIHCEIMYFGEYDMTIGQSIGPKRTYSKLSEDLAALYENPDDSDVEIVVKGHEFCAHKLILKVRSPVFAAMFTHPMEESQQNKVVINDIEKEVFSKVLRYIYTERVENKDINTNMKLFSAADKYNLDDLKSICEEYIGSQLTVEYVSDVLILADNHSAQELKGKAIDFIKKNRNEVMKTNGWAKVVIDRSDLLHRF